MARIFVSAGAAWVVESGTSGSEPAIRLTEDVGVIGLNTGSGLVAWLTGGEA